MDEQDLRDYFAGVALYGVLASDDNEDTWPSNSKNGETYEQFLRRHAERRAEFCYMQANVMLETRLKK